MSRGLRVYYYGVCGAIGGLVAWQISNLLGLSFTPFLLFNEAVVGGLIGLCIGGSLGLMDGILSRNFRHAIRSLSLYGLFGAMGGFIGLPAAEQMFQLSGGMIWGRLIGWAFFGLLIGLAASSLGGAQAWKGGLGGLLGGLMGGLLQSSIQGWLQDLVVGKAIGLILLGASVGAFIALIVFLLARAWLEVRSGKMKGSEFVLDKFKNTANQGAFIGSDALKADIVLPDPDIAPQHAMLKGFDSHFTIKDMSMTGTFLDRKRVEQSPLKNGQVIRVGNTELVYLERR
jgi:hypothetical protein